MDILDQAQDQKQIHSCQNKQYVIASLSAFGTAKRSDGVAISSTFTNAKKSMNFEGISDNAIQDIENFHKQNPKGIVIIRGATATGKTKLSLEIAKKIDIEIISCDSRQFFRKMNIGTDKISAKIRAQIPHHLIDNITPDKHFTAGQRKKEATQKIQKIQSRNKLPCIVGGT